MSHDFIDSLLSSDDRFFRTEVRTFIRTHAPANVRREADIGRYAEKSDAVAWLKALHARGWAAPAWPREYGGCEWPALRQMLFNMECAMNSAPKVVSFGTKMVGPVIYTFGSEAQKSYFLPRILSGEDMWCQGFSEPNAGSDLASLRTKAVREGEQYIVNGQKIWTSKAQFANRIFCLVRTSDQGKPQEGISFLLIDMDTPGITVRPIISIDGSHSLNEVFFDNVRVPVDRRVGEENKGWTYAKFLLGNERTDTSGAGRCSRQIQRIKAIVAQATKTDGSDLTSNASFMADLAEAEIALAALALTEVRYLATVQRGGDIGLGASVLKLKGSSLQQELTRLLREAIGAEAMAFGTEAVTALAALDEAAATASEGVIADYLFTRAATIYGGSNEIQKNIISKAVLTG